MPDCVDPDALTEALAEWDSMEMDDDLWPEKPLVAAARAFLEAPSIWRCLEHKADFLEQTPNEYSLCMSMLYEDAWNTLPEPEPCRPGRVRLVVEE